MKCAESCAERPLPGRLPLFPEPYPGESFYSVLCRYHVRSANASDGHTIKQLFGYNSSMLSTLLTPFHLEMTRYWMPESPNIRAEAMLRDNTAFTVYALGAFPDDIARIQEISTGQRVTGSFPLRMQSRLANHAGRLRYCPACAAEQKKIYGESYWQVLPQLDEVEYCPLHGIRVRNTPISYKHICHHFYPASLVLDSQPPTSCEAQTAWDNLFSTERKFFIKLAQSIAWILRNGMQYEGSHNLCASYRKTMGVRSLTPDYYIIDKRDIKKALDPLAHNSTLYKYMEEKNSFHPNFNSMLGSSLKIGSHILLMTALCGHPKAFYEGAKKGAPV